MTDGVKRLVGGAWVGIPQPPAPPPPPTPGPTPLPTGGGVYTYAATGQTSIQAASAWVATQPANTLTGLRTLTFPTGTYPIRPNFAGAANTPCNLSTKVSHVGQGPLYTIWQVTADPFVPGSQDPLPTASGTTNSLYVVKQEGGTNLTFSGIQIDDATNPITDTRATLPGGGSNPQFNKAIPHNIMRIHGAASPTIQSVKIIGGQGTGNTPPGETFSFNLWACTNAQFLNVEIDGIGKAAALFGVNGNKNGSPVSFTDCYAHDSGHSHGWAMFQAGRVNRLRCRSDRNGLGVGGSGGVGFNSEGSGPVVANFDSSTGNSLDGYRFEAGPIDGGGNRTDHVLTDCVTSGSPYALRTEKLQTTVPTIVRGSFKGTLGTFEYKP